MKRQDAINIIKNHISSVIHRPLEEVAQNILTELEEAGMLPPRGFLKHLGYFDNAWEDDSDGK